jgi:redox-regulated HSP33 family molecular chaperone
MDHEQHPSVFNWHENNYSCDCNRELFFGYAAGLGYEDMPERVCTHGQYSVNLENPETGEIYYREFA